MISKKLVDDLINKYGTSFELELENLKTIKFKGIINNSNNFGFLNNLNYMKNDFLMADPCENNFISLIVSDDVILKEIKSGLIIKHQDIQCQDIQCQDIQCQDTQCQDTKYQVLKYKKYFLSDELYYILVFLTII